MPSVSQTPALEKSFEKKTVFREVELTFSKNNSKMFTDTLTGGKYELSFLKMDRAALAQGCDEAAEYS